jgi:N-acyl-D-glutamate deacylase
VICNGIACSPAQAEDYDLVILNGRVMDPESGLDAVRNVGIKDGKIAVVTQRQIKGKETIDAEGHVVAPGFIDGHAHTTDIPLGQKALLRDGVTTAMELEGGALPIDRWYKNLEGRSQLNYGASVSSAAARTAVFDPNYLKNSGSSADIIHDMFSGVKVTLDTYTRVPTDDEVEQILELVEEGLKQGGLGVGITPGYIVNGYSSRETIGVQKLVGEYGRFSHVHTRFSSQMPPTTGILAFQEFIASAGAYGGGLIIAHFTAQALNLTGNAAHFTAQALNLTGNAIEYVDALRAGGTPVILELYPYNFGASGNGVGADYLKPDNYQKNMGRSYNDIINTATGERLTKETYEGMVKSNPFAPVLFYNATDEDMLMALAHPSTLVGCDCFYFTNEKGEFVSDWDTPFESVNTHPRTTGSHGKVLRLTREKNLMPLMTAISKMTVQYADFLAENGVPQMGHKGRIREGADADITVFDPQTVRDNSSLEKGKNALPTTGIPYVIVNGSLVVKDSKVLEGVYAGEPVRLPVQH